MIDSPPGTTIMPMNKHIHLHTTDNRAILMLGTHRTGEGVLTRNNSTESLTHTLVH